jgi:hypothetical protein
LTQYREYVPLAPNEKYEKFSKIQKLFDVYAKTAKCGATLCRKGVLFDIVERVEKRRVYFRIFHNIVMSERNETSLYCFWILKLAPFFDSENPDRHINVTFALFLFLRMIQSVKRGAGNHTSVNHKSVQNLYYAFLYRDISKEAIMLAADTLLA